MLEILAEAPENPSMGDAIKFVRVSDLRQFQIDPPSPEIPSLMNDEIDDSSITSRAIARKRNTYGAALGDILLPEGQTVMKLVEKSLAKGLRENGYRVFTERDSEYQDAAPIEVGIEKFWGWFEPGFWSAKLHFQTLIRLNGPVGPFRDGEEFDSHVVKSIQFASDDSWRATIKESLLQLNKDITEGITAYRVGGRKAQIDQQKNTDANPQNLDSVDAKKLEDSGESSDVETIDPHKKHLYFNRPGAAMGY